MSDVAIGGVEGVVQPFRAAEYKGQQNEHLKYKKLIFSAQKILNY
jgi:hypothetical protein